MNTLISQISKQLDLIETTSSRNDKMALLAQLLESDTLQPLTSLLYEVGLDEQISTFITKLPINDIIETSPILPQEIDQFITSLLLSIKNGRRLTKQDWIDVTSALYVSTDPISFKWLSKCLIKDWTLGTSITTYNKLAKTIGITPIQEFDTVRVSNIQDAILDYQSGVYVSVKKDGVNATYTPQGIIRSRNGNIIALKHIEDQLQAIKGQYVLFGELVSSDRQSSSGLCNSAIKLGYDSTMNVSSLDFYIFDILTADEYNSNNFHTPFCERMKLIEPLIIQLNQPNIKFVTHNLVHSLEEVYAINDSLVSKGEEGIIINAPDMLFEFNRSKKRARIKECLTADLEIVDVLPHSKNPDWVGSLTVRTKDNLVITNTGSGLNEIPNHNKNRIDLWKNKESLIGKIARVKYNKVILANDSKSFSLFIPVLDEIREPHDKSVADSFEDLVLGSNQKHENLRKLLK